MGSKGQVKLLVMGTKASGVTSLSYALKSGLPLDEFIVEFARKQILPPFQIKHNYSNKVVTVDWVELGSPPYVKDFHHKTQATSADAVIVCLGKLQLNLEAGADLLMIANFLKELTPKKPILLVLTQCDKIVKPLEQMIEEQIKWGIQRSLSNLGRRFLSPGPPQTSEEQPVKEKIMTKLVRRLTIQRKSPKTLDPSGQPEQQEEDQSELPSNRTSKESLGLPPSLKTSSEDFQTASESSSMTEEDDDAPGFSTDILNSIYKKFRNGGIPFTTPVSIKGQLDGTATMLDIAVGLAIQQKKFFPCDHLFGMV